MRRLPWASAENFPIGGKQVKTTSSLSRRGQNPDLEEILQSLMVKIMSRANVFPPLQGERHRRRQGGAREVVASVQGANDPNAYTTQNWSAKRLLALSGV